MEYIIKTQQKLIFTFDTDQSPLATFMAELNNDRLTAISLSNIGMNKRNILALAPKEAIHEPGEGVYRLNTVDGTGYLVKLDEGDTVNKVVARVNDHTQRYVKIGEVVIQSQTFDFIVNFPAPDAPEEQVTA